MTQTEHRTGSLSAMVGIALVVAFFVLLGSLTTVIRFRDRERESRQEAVRALQREASAWDKRVYELGAQWLDQLRNMGERAQITDIERSHRQRIDWFDSYYLWQVQGSAESRRTRILFPVPPPTEDLPAINEAPCMARAHAVPETEPSGTRAAAFLACVDGADPARALFATVYAGHILERDGRHDEALAALARLPAPTSLSEATQQGYAPKRLVLRQLLYVDILSARGDQEAARDALVALGLDAADQRGPVVEEVYNLLLYTILPRLSDLGADAQAEALRPLVIKAGRRLGAWREVNARLSASMPRSDGPLLAYDQYSDDPFLLLYEALGGDGLYGAVQLDQPALLEGLLAEASDPTLVVTNAAGERIAGSEAAIATTEPFPTLLTHLRLGFTEQRLVEAHSQNVRQTLREAFGVAVMSALGIWAIFALRSAQLKEQALIDRQKEFVTRVTHELKTPLAGIRVMAESLEMMDEPEPETIATFSRRIISEADRLTQRIEEILAVGRAARPAAPAAYDFAHMLREVLDEWEPRLNDAGMTMVRDLQSAAVVQGDRALMRDAVACLLDNALKYRRTDRSDPRVWVSLRSEPGEVQLAVSDNGLGVPAAKRKVIFERFARVEGPGRGKSGGHGLGLAFVAEAVSAQRGRVECREGVEGGARFVVRLPTSG